MAGHPDKFQLLEFQPQTVYLPENQNATTGTFRRPGSAEDRDPEAPPRYPPGRAHSPPVVRRDTEYARIGRNYHDVFEGTGPRERAMPPQELPHPADAMKAPLLNRPVYLLVPADSSNPSPGKFAPEERYYGRPEIPMDGHAIRRRPTYIRERIVEPYAEKNCCSCWRCMIALIVILTIIGLGLAITGIIFIKLIHHESQPDTFVTNVTDGLHHGPRGRSADDLAPFAFDIDVANGTGPVKLEITTLDPNATSTTAFAFDGNFHGWSSTDSPGNASFDFMMEVTGVGGGNVTVAPNVTTTKGVNVTVVNATLDSLNATNLHVVQVQLRSNATSFNVSLAGDIPSVSVVVESDAPNLKTVAHFGVENSSAFDVNGTDLSVLTTAGPSALAFHHPVDPIPPTSVGPVFNVTRGSIDRFALGQRERDLAAHPEGWRDPVLMVPTRGAAPPNSTDSAVTTLPLP